ncbi:unnamed protein product [Urochloa decumbens]|uniref:HAT C-terminal dimerisation domain-containing protein n=1 Tax=Urochloa decumbens TaxID=240449 RepID=A0ABC8YAZ2_9POAL
MYKHRDVLKCLFSNEDWGKSKLSSTETGGSVREIVLAPTFWNGVEDCIKASEPLLAVLRTVYGGVKPAMPEVFGCLDLAKKKISDSFACNPIILKKVSDLADQYESAESCFGKKLPMLQRMKKSPNDWWTAYGGSAGELQKFAQRITGLYCSASGYDCNWTMFERINTTFINQSERKRLEDYGYIRYNRVMANRFERQRSEGSNFDPLILEDCELGYDWVGMYAEHFNSDDLPWQLVEEVTNGSYTLEDHYRLRKNFCEMMNSEQESTTTSRLTDGTGSDTEEENDSFVVDDEDIEDDYGHQDPLIPSDDESERSDDVVRMVDPFDMDEFLKDL